jgi:hypothetical protein
MKFAQRHCEEERSDDAAIQRAPEGAPKEEAPFGWRASRALDCFVAIGERSDVVLRTAMPRNDGESDSTLADHAARLKTNRNT